MESYSKVDVCYIYFVHWSVNRHLVVSTVLVTVNIVEMNMDSRSALDAPVTVPPLSLSGISRWFYSTIVQIFISTSRGAQSPSLSVFAMYWIFKNSHSNRKDAFSLWFHQWSGLLNAFSCASPPDLSFEEVSVPIFCLFFWIVFLLLSWIPRRFWLLALNCMCTLQIFAHKLWVIFYFYNILMLTKG